MRGTVVTFEGPLAGIQLLGQSNLLQEAPHHVIVIIAHVMWIDLNVVVACDGVDRHGLALGRVRLKGLVLDLELYYEAA